MEKQRRRKVILIITLMLVISGLTIGFAAFTSVLSISSSATVTPNESTFSVKFSTLKDSLKETGVVPSNVSTGVEYTNGVINNTSSPTLTNLSAIFTSPGQSVTYTVYARNEGEYAAYLNNINYIGEKTCTPGTGTTASLVESACNSIKMTVTVAGREYTATTGITGHALSKKTGEEVKVKLSYETNGELADGEFTVSFGDVTLVYSSIDDTSMPPIVSEKIVKLESGTLNDYGSMVSIGNEQFYVIGQEDGNVKLLSMMNITLDDNPVQSSSAGTTIFKDTVYGNTVNYSNSIVKGYVDNYAAYLEDLGVNISEARLISKEELATLGCNDEVHCSEAPKWVYGTNYWTMSNESMYFYVVYVDAEWNKYQYDKESIFGVRPVIIISESEF